MKECNKLIKCNTLKHVKYSKIDKFGIVRIDFTKYKEIGGKEIKLLLEEVGNSLIFHSRKLKILQISFNEVEFVDKLTYIIFECLLYDLFVSYNILTEINFKGINKSLQTDGVKDSLFVKLINRDINYDGFLKKFFHIYSTNHFRRIIKGNAPDDSIDICKLMTDVKTFLKFFNIDELYRNQISEMISELADNAREHTKTDCLIDIDVTTDYNKRGSEDKEYCAFNIVIINFSDTCLGSSLKEKILNYKYYESERYEKVNKAYNLHKKLFCNDYQRDDFFNIASFQDNISGRFYDITSGGTGLRSLIKSLEENSDTHYGYVLSGNNGIQFVLDYLKFNDDNWIGFNENNDFINQIPSNDVILKSNTYIPGTAYNFTLVVEIGGQNG